MYDAYGFSPSGAKDPSAISSLNMHYGKEFKSRILKCFSLQSLLNSVHLLDCAQQMRELLNISF